MSKMSSAMQCSKFFVFLVSLATTFPHCVDSQTQCVALVHKLPNVYFGSGYIKRSNSEPNVDKPSQDKILHWTLSSTCDVNRSVHRLQTHKKKFSLNIRTCCFGCLIRMCFIYEFVLAKHS